MKHIYFFALFFTLSACMEEIPYESSNIAPKIVLYSAISQDSTISVLLRSSKSIDDTTLPNLNDARVFLYIDDIFEEELTFDSAGIYTSTIKGEVGQKYKIIAEHDDFKTITATTEILPKPIINSHEFIYNCGNMPSGENASKVTINISDISNQDNYYFLNTILLSNKFMVFSQAQDPALLGEKEMFLRYIFTDNLFKNSDYNIILLLEDSYEDTLNYYFNFQTITEDFYKFQNSYIDYYYAYNNNYFDFNTEPTEVYSNVENGYGIFYSYNQTTYIITYIKQ